MRKQLLTLAAAIACAGTAQAAPLMSTEWAQQACQYWNTNTALTKDLFEKWGKNDGGRGYKVIHMYRTDCGEATKVEMTISTKDGKTSCVYAGPVQHAKLDPGMDYKMHAETKRWHEMGNGEYGPMRAMMFGRLQFEGPKVEAMKVMGPFEQFLLIPGKIPGDDTCPGK
ncbi:sterol-binding protein [Parasulfuritortus cantonensis]|uniref:Sterol-binding protein n=1 Tax=Parasulfuritortus cantonensis TaxID=2528202 RepID=A0A4R1BDI7_9PROT|nr:SCP2 sterol-binding domain-containing protein [Parasulfuritortus cantonensis]TCJ15048.1 sterol-binding protein [Parasulfuritortus cantonensis]